MMLLQCRPFKSKKLAILMMQTLISLLRPRTLPLALAVICVGNALAFAEGGWRASVFGLSLLTALSLQMLSNVANDYGDGIRGTDRHRDAASPKRLTAGGIVSPRQMRLYIFLLILLCLGLGGWLIALSLQEQSQILLFVCLGLLSIAAAVGYTVGRCAYGYAGLGEAAVLLFFGIVGVLGSYALQRGSPTWPLLLPALAVGLLCAAVLNVNNMRDIDSDRAAGKHTLAVRLGFLRAKYFHALLLIAACACLLLFNLIAGWKTALWLLLFPLLRRHGQAILQAPAPQLMGLQLKPAVMLCLGISLLLSLGIIL